MPLALRRPEAKIARAPAGEVELENGRAAFLDVHALLADIAARADGHEQLRPVGAGQQGPCPMMANGQIQELGALVGDACVAGLVGKRAPRCPCWRRRAGRPPAPFRTADASPSRNTNCSSATPSRLVSRSSEIRLAFSTIEPDRRCTMFWTIVRGHQDFAGSLAASATSTSPLGSTCSHRGCFRPCANATTCRPAAALGVCPFFHGSFATDQLMVGSQLSCGAGSLGCSPYPGGSCWACAARKASQRKALWKLQAQVAHCIGRSPFRRSNAAGERDVPAMNSVSGTNSMAARCRPGRSAPGAAPRLAVMRDHGQNENSRQLERFKADTTPGWRRWSARSPWLRPGRSSWRSYQSRAALRAHGRAYRLDERRGAPRSRWGSAAYRCAHVPRHRLECFGS